MESGKPIRKPISKSHIWCILASSEQTRINLGHHILYPKPFVTMEKRKWKELRIWNTYGMEEAKKVITENILIFYPFGTAERKLRVGLPETGF